MNTTCSFAHTGTYGHECGAPAVLVAVKVAEPTKAYFPPMTTKSGLYYAPRCARCAEIKGGENRGALRFERLDADKHINEWVAA